MKSYDISGLNILVLERHLLIRNLLTDVFKEFGVPTVHSTGDLGVAWKIFNTMPVDIILCDWCPGLDGLEFLHYVRNHEDTPDPFVCVIMITAYTELFHVVTARDEGMTEYLAKPVSAKLLYSRIVHAIEGHRQYIRSSDFFGPDRRRKSKGDLPQTERRQYS